MKPNRSEKTRKILSICGLPGSGKTTAIKAIKNLGIVVSMGDIVRNEAKKRNIEPSGNNIGKIAKELREDRINKRFGVIQQNYDLDLKKHDVDIQALQVKQEEFTNSIIRENRVVEITGGVLGVFGIITLISALITVFYRSPKWIEKEIYQQISNISTTEREKISQIVEEQEIENRLKETKRLLLLSVTEEQREECEANAGDSFLG